MNKNSFNGDRASLLRELRDLKMVYDLPYHVEEFKEENIEDEKARVRYQKDQIKQELQSKEIKKEEKKRKIEILDNLYLQKQILRQIEKNEEFDDSENDSSIIHIISNKEEEKMEDSDESSDSDEPNKFSEDIQFTQDMPECFEKSIVEIKYLLYLLTLNEPIDKMNDEKIKDNVKTRLNELKNKLERNHNPSKKSYISQVRNLQAKIISEIRPFFFSQFFALMKINDENSQILKDKDIIPLLGTTGSGKSTTIQYLYGADMQSINFHIQAKDPIPDELKNFIASNRMRSITRNINHIQVQSKNSQDDTICVYLVDTPGYDDTNGPEIDASNTFGIIKSIQKARQVYPVLMFSSDDLGCRWQQMKEQLQFYASMINKMESVSFYFTKWRESGNIKDKIVMTIQDLNGIEFSMKPLNNALRILKRQNKAGHVRILDPLDKQGSNQIKHILRQDPIKNPAENFNLNLKGSTSQKIQTQVESHIYFIKGSLEQLQFNQIFELVKFKINELKQLAQIFKAFKVQNYQEKLQQVRKFLTDHQDQMLKSQRILTQMFLSQGQILSDQDIDKTNKVITQVQKIESLLQLINQEGLPSDQINENLSQDEGLQTILDQCKSKATFLFNEADISDSQWYEYMNKAKKLSQLKGCEKLEQNLNEKYYQKLKLTSDKAIKAIHEIQINSYSQQKPESLPEEEKQGLKNNQPRQEKIPKLTKSHEIFTNFLQTVLNAQKKAQEFNMIQLSNEIQKEHLMKIEESIEFLGCLAQPYFNFFTRESKYLIIKDNIDGINLVFNMLNSYYKSCIKIFPTLGNIIHKILKNYTEKSIEAFIFQKNEIFSLLQLNDSEKLKTIKQHYDQLKLLFEINQIKGETQQIFNETQSKLQNQEALIQIEQILKDLQIIVIGIFQENLETFNQEKNQKLENLKKALKSLEIIEISYTDSSKFKLQAIVPIEQAFKKLYDSICDECENYSMSIDTNPKNLSNIALLNDFLQEIIQLASSQKIENVLLKNQPLNHIKILWQYMLEIRSKFESIKNRLMIRQDFTDFLNYLAFLGLFMKPGGQIFDNYKKLLSDIKIIDQSLSQKIHPSNIIECLKQSLQKQQENIQKDFETNFQQLEQASSSYQIQNQKLEDQIKTIQEIAKKIVEIFRIEHSIKKLENKLGNIDPNIIQNYSLEAKIKNNYFNFLDEQFIQGQNRSWILLKFESMKILQELDEFIPNQIASKCFSNLKKYYCLNQDEEVKNAQKQFDDGKFQELSEKLNELQKLKTDPNNFTILNSIKKYINFQTNCSFDLLCNKKYANNQELTQENALFIYKETEYLLKIDANLQEFIQIRSQNIQDQLKAEIFEYLEEQFKIQIEVIDRLMQDRFQKCQQNIDIMRTIFTNNILHKYIELSKQQAQRIKKFTNEINNKQQQLLKKIDVILDQIISKKFHEFDRRPFASQIFEQISDENQRESFLSKLKSKYEDKFQELKDQISKSQFPRDIEKIKQEVDQINNCKQFMPEKIKNIIEENFKIIKQKYEQSQSQYEKKLKDQLIKGIDPLILSTDYLANFKIDEMDNESHLNIQQYLNNHIQDLIKNMQNSLSRKNLNELFESMSLMLQYINDKRLSKFINKDMSEKYSQIHFDIKQMFNDAIIDISSYFKLTHGKNGEPICLQILQNEKSRPEISLEVIMNLLNLQKKYATIIEKQMPDFIQQFKELIDIAVEYLRDMKDQHHQLKENGYFYESISVLSNLKFTGQINQGDYFNQFLKSTKKIYQFKIDELHKYFFFKELNLTQFEKLQAEVKSKIENQMEFNLNQKLLEIKRSSQKQIESFNKEYYYNYDQIKQAYLAGQKSRFNQNSWVQQKYQEVKNKIDAEMELALENMKKINIKIKTGIQLTQQQFQEFNFLTISFNSMQREFVDYRHKIENMISNTNEVIKERLLNLEKKSQEFLYQDNDQLHRVSLYLSQIQEMSQNIILYQEEIIQSLDRIILDYSQKTYRDPNAVQNLMNHLIGIQGPYGKTISQIHPFFKGANIQQTNEQFDGKKLPQVMEEIKGEENDLNKNAKLLLKQYYEDFNIVFWEITKDKLLPRILGVGYSQPYRNGQKFNSNWKNLFGHPSAIRNNLVQIKTGEGKSVVLAAVSMVLALNGFEISCACYSKYLSERDFEDFQPMFRELEIQNMIQYGTFGELAEHQLNREGDIREIVKCLVLKDQFIQKRPNINFKKDIPPQVLLIDEVDIFFSKKFFGEIYIPAAQIKHQSISDLQDYIWKYRQERIKEMKNMSEEDQQKYNQNPYMSLKNLKETQQYKNVKEIFKPEYQFLVEEAANRMIFDVIEYEKSNDKYFIKDGKIGYEELDLISTKITVRYQTLFAYYLHHAEGKISDNDLKQQNSILIDCTLNSIAEVPLQYDIILGMTGTLDTLSQTQKQIIQNKYSIEHLTFSPSVYTNDISSIFNVQQGGIHIVDDPEEYYRRLTQQIIPNFYDNKRPIIVFFENNEALQTCLDSNYFERFKYQIISEQDSSREKQNKVLNATLEKQITLTTKIFGRGTDFRCHDSDINSKGGLVVIQTFFSEDLSEETQIRGRTGRQGKNGTYMLYLNLKDLAKFKFDIETKKKSQNFYETLNELRNQYLLVNEQSNLIEIEEKKDDHIQSLTLIHKIKKSMANQSILEPIYQKQLNEHLLALNRGNLIQKDQTAMKLFILLDCTVSMEPTLKKTKNCLKSFIKNLKQLMRENQLDENLLLIKIGGYRNYLSLDKKLFQASPSWTSDSNALCHFLQSTLEVDGGQGNEAIEIALWHANQEIKADNGIPLSMIIIIGDAPPNTVEEVTKKRKIAADFKNNPDFWDKTRYKEETHWEKELVEIQKADVLVHAFYVLEEKTSEQRKAQVENEFKKLCVNEGKCQFLDIQNQEKGQKQLEELLIHTCLHRAAEINFGREAADKVVAKIRKQYIS